MVFALPCHLEVTPLAKCLTVLANPLRHYNDLPLFAGLRIPDNYRLSRVAIGLAKCRTADSFQLIDLRFHGIDDRSILQAALIEPLTLRVGQVVQVGVEPLLLQFGQFFD